jgi:hypothetical protein
MSGCNEQSFSFKITKKQKWEEVYEKNYQDIWESFYSDSTNNHVFFHPSLCYAWIETYLPLRKINPLFYLIEWNKKKMLMPLIIWRKNWKNFFQVCIVPLGYGDFDYSDPISIGNVSPQEFILIWEEILDDIKSTVRYDIIDIKGLHYKTFEGLSFYKTFDKSSFIDLNESTSFNAFLDTITDKQKKELKRRQTRLEELGKIEIKHYSKNNLKEALIELQEMLKVHINHWPKAYKAKGFHMNLVKRGLEAGLLHFSVIKLDGYSISWRIGFFINKVYYSYMPAYRYEFSKYSPGKFHLLICIKYAIENNCLIYDLLKGNEKYKEEWATGFEPIGGFTFKSNHVSSGIRNTLQEIKNSL